MRFKIYLLVKNINKNYLKFHVTCELRTRSLSWRQVRAVPVKSVHTNCRTRSTRLSLFSYYCQCHLS